MASFKSFRNCVWLIFAFSFQLFREAQTNKFVGKPSIGVVSTCEQTLIEESGRISYNYPGIPIKYDRCIWVLRVENATGYDIDIYGFNAPYASTHQMSFTGFNHADVNQTEFHLLNEGAPKTLRFVKSNIVVIVFETSYWHDNPNGVDLRYSATFSGGLSKPSKLSTDFFLHPNENRQTLELSQLLNETSTINQLTTVMFTLPNRNYLRHGRINVTVSESGEDTCAHVLYYYTYWSKTGEWEIRHSSCLAASYGIDTGDIVLFVFRTNEEVEDEAGSRFTISYYYYQHDIIQTVDEI